MTPNLEAWLKSLEEAESKASAAPWKNLPDGIRCDYPSKRDPSWNDWIARCHMLPVVGHREFNSSLITQSRNALPKLLAIIRIQAEAMTIVGGPSPDPIWILKRLDEALAVVDKMVES